MIHIINENLANYVMFKLDKIENGFTEEELASIEDMVVDPLDIIGNATPIDMSVIKYFTGAKTMEFRDLIFTNKDIVNIYNLPKLQQLTFYRCKFEDVNALSILKNIQGLEIANCPVNAEVVFSLKQLTSLTYTNNKIDTNKLNNLKNLKFLQISCSTLSNFNIDLPNLEDLYIDGTNIQDLSFTNNLYNLKKLSISQAQYNQNIELVKNLQNHNVIVLHDGMVEF